MKPTRIANAATPMPCQLEAENTAQPLSPSRPIHTLADLLAEVDTWADRKIQARRVLKANIRTAGFIAVASKARADGRMVRLSRDDATFASVPADAAWLNRYLFAYPASLVGTKEQCRRLSVSGLRHALRRVGLIESYSAATPTPPGGPWHDLLKSLEAHVLCRAALTNFARWCHANGIEPEHVSRQTLERYETFVRTRTLHSEIPRLIGTIAKAWRKAAKLLQGWPGAPLVPRPRRDRYTSDFSEFPASFQGEVAAFAERLGGTGRRQPFRNAGLRRPLRPSSVKIRLYSLRQAASALVLLGRDPATITGLADLVDEAAFEAILQFYWDRGVAARVTPEQRLAGCQPRRELGVTAQTGAIASALMIVAKHHCKLDSATLARLRSMAQDVTPPPQSQISQKNRDRLRQFDDPVLRAKLLHLPERLMRLAEGSGLRPFETARLARVAAAIELLLHVPLRNKNLTELKLGAHLRYGDVERKRISHLVVECHETKNSYNGEWAVGPELAAFLDRYIQRFRPLLAMAEGDWLFPAGFGKAGPLSPVTMAQQMERVVADEVGAVVNPHLFRCLCARFVLERSPHALEDVRLLLGDKTLQVVLAHYAAVEPSQACRRNDEMLRRMRHDSAHLAGPPAKPAKRAKPAKSARKPRR